MAKRTKKREKCTKCGNLPHTQQPGHLALSFVRSSFPVLSIDKEVPRLSATKRRRETTDDPRLPIPGMEFKILIMGQEF